MKYLRYVLYLLRHKYYVFKIGLEYQVPIINLIFHDWTRFLPVEFFGYCEWLNSGWRKVPLTARADAPKELVLRFDIAFNHHIKSNKHHWQYWLVTYDEGDTTTLPIPDKHRREMLSDWIGSGIAINGYEDIKEWYDKYRDNMRLCEETRVWIEEQIRIREFKEKK